MFLTCPDGNSESRPVYLFTFAPLTIGISILVAAMQTVWAVTKGPVHLAGPPCRSPMIPTGWPVDEIVVLGHGRVMERGTHACLLATGGYYARMWAERTHL